MEKLPIINTLSISLYENDIIEVSAGPRIGLCENCIIGGSQIIDTAFVSFYSPYKRITNTALVCV